MDENIWLSRRQNLLFKLIYDARFQVFRGHYMYVLTSFHYYLFDITGTLYEVYCTT